MVSLTCRPRRELAPRLEPPTQYQLIFTELGGQAGGLLGVGLDFVSRRSSFKTKGLRFYLYGQGVELVVGAPFSG